MKGNARRGSERRSMTADEARSFERVSVENAVILLKAAEERGCSCQPYQDWFTFERWAAQGYHVRRGEHGVCIPTIRTMKKTDDEGNEKIIRRPWRTYVFCRCQVEANDPAAVNMPAVGEMAQAMAVA